MKKAIVALGLFSLLFTSGCKKSEKKTEFIESSVKEYNYDGSNWYTSRVYNFYFDDNKNYTKKDIFIYNSYTSTLENRGYETYTYDEKGNIIEIVETIDDEYSSRHLYEYDTKNRLIEYTYYDRFDKGNNKWIGFIKDTYEYKNNNIFEYVSYIYKSKTEKWQASAKVNYSYNKNNKVIEEIGYWNSSEDDNVLWLYSYKNEYEYDKSNNNNLTKEYGYDDVENNWYIAGKCEKEFDDKGNCIVSNGFEWDKYKNDFEKVDEYTGTYSYTYDSYGNIIVEVINEKFKKLKIERTFIEK